MALPTGADHQLLVGVVFAESTTKNTGTPSADEMVAIARTVVNQAYYAKMAPPPGKRKCWNTSFGDGTLLSAIKNGVVAYGKDRWNMVMSGDRLKSEAAIGALKPDDKAHFEAVVAAVGALVLTPAPLNDAKLGGIPVGFNQAIDSPPNKSRQKKLGRFAQHSFYGFLAGRECE